MMVIRYGDGVVVKVVMIMAVMGMVMEMRMGVMGVICMGQWGCGR